MMAARVLTALAAVLTLAAAAPAAAEAPPYVAKGACPFECCTYGVWPVKADVEVHAEPDAGAPVVARLSSGTRVRVVTGEVHVVPGLARAIAKPHSSAAGLDPQRPIEILDYVGEGYSRVRQGGRVSQVKIARSKRRCVESPNRRYCWAEVVREPVSSWWVRVALPGSRTGWVLMDGGLEPTDACG